MPPDELIPSPKYELGLGKAASNEITARMAEDLLALSRKKDELSDDAPVHFICPNLEKTIREKLEKPDAPITHKDMTNLVTLDGRGQKISKLDGMEFATNLTILWLYRNEISDLTPLTNLTKFTKLYLQGNQISNLMPLAQMKNLTVLHLQYNEIFDLRFLTNLTNLRSLNLTRNTISESEKTMIGEALPECNISF